MERIAALLRAVNVGGTGKLPMAELRHICSTLGFADVRTYIASGNLVFSTDGDAAEAHRKLEAALTEHMGKPQTALIRSGPELKAIVAANPFPNADPSQVAVLFLPEAPEAEPECKGLKDESIVPGKRELFIHYPSGMGKSRLVIRAAAQGTARNLATVRKLAALAASPE